MGTVRITIVYEESGDTTTVEFSHRDVVTTDVLVRDFRSAALAFGYADLNILEAMLGVADEHMPARRDEDEEN
jgi:hypothetical protein